MLDVLENIKQSLEKASCVLIGIGEEFADKGFEEWQEYRMFLSKAEDEGLSKEQKSWFIPYLKAEYFRTQTVSKKIQKAYHRLESLIEDKNYFVITLNTDHRIYQTKINPERITTPCGSYEYLQCINNCQGHNLIQDATTVVNKIKMAKSLSKIEKPVCQFCGQELVFNIYTEPHYDESGYLEQWKVYQEWLGQTLNKELCILELGVGFEVPSVIRWPFEKIAFFNQKAQIIRVHSQFSQLPEDIATKSISCKQNPVELLSN